MSLAKPFLNPSRVCGTGVSSDRNSSSTFFTDVLAMHPIPQALEVKMAALVNCVAAAVGRHHLRLVEATQIVRYTQGEYYALHRDNSTDGVSPALPRAATLIIYLNTAGAGAGGETFFPKAAVVRNEILQGAGVQYHRRGGFGVRPVQGHALLFWSALPNGNEDLAALHAAMPVGSGEKWVATRWFSEVEMEK